MPVKETANRIRVGKMVWTIDGNAVIVTHDTKDGSFNSVALYTYRNQYAAYDAAWLMACRQASR